MTVSNMRGKASTGLLLLPVAALPAPRRRSWTELRLSAYRRCSRGRITFTQATPRVRWSVHTHTAANVTDFSEAVDDRVGSLLTPGSNITLNYNDAANTLTINSSASAVTPAALTKGDDTNVTLTLGGTPATALLAASSITAGWNGTLAAARGGFGTSVAASNGVPLFATGVPTFTSTTGTGTFVRAADPALTGNPTAPTQTAGDNDTSIATTAFVTTAVTNGSVPPATVAPLMNGAAAVGTTTKYAREDHVHPTHTSTSAAGFSDVHWRPKGSDANAGG